MFPPCSPTWDTQPHTTSSIKAGSRSFRSRIARRTWADRSAGCQSRSTPLRLPPAVRTASTITAVLIVASWSVGRCRSVSLAGEHGAALLGEGHHCLLGVLGLHGQDLCPVLELDGLVERRLEVLPGDPLG